MNRISFVTAASIFAVFMHGPAQAQTTIELDQDGNPFLSIPLDDTQPVTINPETGELRATAASGFSCSTGGCEDVQVSFASADGGFFIVDGGSSTSVPETGSVTFDWGARGAWECQGSGLPGTNWNNPGKLPFGPLIVSVSNLAPGNYDAGLTCSNGAGNVDSATTVQINVQESSLQIPPQCQGRQPASAVATPICVTDDRGNPRGDINCFAYASVFGGEFPGSTQGKDFFTDIDQYVAMEFSTAGLTESDGRWNRVPPQVPPTTTGSKIWTISQCPGDFDREAITSEMGDSDCYVKTADVLLPSVRWHRAGTQEPIGGACELQPNQTYFMNIMYSTDPAGTPPANLTWDCQSNSAAQSCSDNIAPNFNQ